MAQRKFITPEFRGSFVAIDKPKRVKGDDTSEPKFQVLAAFDKDDEDTHAELQAMVEAAAIDKWGKVPPKFKSPIKDGDDEEYDNLKGKWTLNLTNTKRPGVVDADVDPIMDMDEIYSGAWYRASIRCYAWEHPTGGKGASFSLDNLMKIRDDERFDGATSAEDDFADFKKGGVTKKAGKAAKTEAEEDEDDLLG